jgi:hypothetical protein
MNRKYRITLVILFVVVLIGSILYFSWTFENATTLEYQTKDGITKTTMIPSIPGVLKVEDIVDGCTQEVGYAIKISQVSAKDASSQILDIVKERLESEGWGMDQKYQNKSFWHAEFVRDEEKLIVETSEKDNEPFVTLLYSWPPCSI